MRNQVSQCLWPIFLNPRYTCLCAFLCLTLFHLFLKLQYSDYNRLAPFQILLYMINFDILKIKTVLFRLIIDYRFLISWWQFQKNGFYNLRYYKIREMKHGQQFRTKREQFSTQIRRQQREQILAKRRNILKNEQTNEDKTNSAQHVIDARFADSIKQFQAEPAKKEQFMTYFAAINDPDIYKQHYGVIGIRKLLTHKLNPPIQQVIDAGLVPKLILYAKQTEYPQLQLQSVWCLTNVAAGNSQQTNSIIEKGGVKIFVDLLLSEHAGIVEQAVWALGNIACDSAGYRDMILKAGGLQNLKKVIQIAISELPKSPVLREIIQSATWAISGICRTKPLPSYKDVAQAMPVFFYVVQNNLIKDTSILANICWAISYKTDNKKQQYNKKIDKIQNCIDSGVVPKFIQFLDQNNDQLMVSSLKILGNIANGNDYQCQYLINIGLIPKLQQLLYRQKKVYRKQSCWVLSNLAAGPTQQIQVIFSNQKLVSKLLQLLSQDVSDVKSQICYIFANATERGDKVKVMKFLQQISIMTYLGQIIMQEAQVDLLIAALQSIRDILELGKQHSQHKNQNVFLPQLFRLGAITKLEELQHHDSDKIYDEVAVILSKYFELEDPLKV